jgi:hypothetical protein
MRAKDGAQPPVSPKRTQSEKTSASAPGAAQHGRNPPPQPAIKRKMWKKEKTGRRPEKTYALLFTPFDSRNQLWPNRHVPKPTKHMHQQTSTRGSARQLNTKRATAAGPRMQKQLRHTTTLHLLCYYRLEKISRVQELLELHHYMNIQEP